MATQKREVSDFNRVRMEDFGVLTISQGEQESLTIEADEETLEKIYTHVDDGQLILRVGRDFIERLGIGLQTSLTRPHIEYQLTVKDLAGLTVAGFGLVSVGELKARSLSVTLAGGGEVVLTSLTAEQLEVELKGGGKIEVAGKASEQLVTLSGAGRYAGRQLESQRARVTISGAGSASVWVTEDLEIALSGVGSLEYYGSPAVKQRISGLGSIKRLGK